MINRKRRLKTKEITALVAPITLLDALYELKARGDVESYQIGKYITTIKLTKYTDFATIFKEQTAAVTNPRPYVANKSNDPWKNHRKN